MACQNARGLANHLATGVMPSNAFFAASAHCSKFRPGVHISIVLFYIGPAPARSKPSARYTRRATSACPDISGAAQGGDILVDAECDRKRTISENPKQCIMRLGESREQMHRLSQCRLTHEKRRVQLLNPITLNISAVASHEPECPARTELHPLIVVVLPTLSRRKRTGR